MKKHVVMCLLCVVAVVIMAGCSSDQPDLPEVPVQPTLTAHERAVLTRAHESLVWLAHQSEVAKSILAFYDLNAVPATRLANGDLLTVDSSRALTYFYVWVHPESVSVAHNTAVVAATFDMDTRALSLCDGDFSRISRGLFLAHELPHASDWVTGQEPYSEPLSPEWLYGELRAHMVVRIILDQFTDGRWEEIVSLSRDEREQLVLSMGRRPEAFTLNALPNDSVRVAELFDSLSYSDISFLLTQLTVDANVTNVERYAGAGTEQALQGIMEFLGVFYGKYRI